MNFYRIWKNSYILNTVLKDWRPPIADDIVLFSEFAESLQAQIDLFYNYCEIWNLIISSAKTKIVIYNQKYAKHSFSFTPAKITLEIVDKYK